MNVKGMKVAVIVANGFDLGSWEDAGPILTEWNEHCIPPWSDDDLKAYFDWAVSVGGTAENPGWLAC